MGPHDKNSPGKEKPLLLFAALDWGLGHTTRSIPIIQELVKKGANVIIACNSAQKKIFEEEFPQVGFVSLKGYDIRYGKSAATTRWLLLFQIKKILTRIKFENRWLEAFLAQNPVAGVISDNRYGFYSAGVPSILITHQLSIQTGFGAFADRFVRKRLYRLIGKFRACWVPDMARERGSIGGQLSHPKKMPGLPVYYLGCISRLAVCPPASTTTTPPTTTAPTPARYTDVPPANIPDQHRSAVQDLMPEDRIVDGKERDKLLILLSGPEPQRSIFEEILFKQLAALAMPAIIVRGLPEEALRDCKTPGRPAGSGGEDEKAAHDYNMTDRPPSAAPPGCMVLNYVGTAELNRLICNAGLVICRPGYTTLMDMLKLGKKTVMVPTPGQAEQEYLAVHAQLNRLALVVPQHRFSLGEALRQTVGFEYRFPDKMDTTAYQEIVGSFVRSLFSSTHIDEILP